MIGTMSFEDLYGAGSLDTLPPSEASQTQQKANPNNPDTTGNVKSGEEGILNVFKNKNFLGQPLIIWFGIVILLVAIKYFVEFKK